MTRTTAIWTLVIGFIALPALVMGILRGRAVVKAFVAICADLREAGIELSQAELREMLSQLHRNPEAIFHADSSAESIHIKKRHVDALAPYLKRLRFGSSIHLAVGFVAVLLLQYLWPQQ